MTVVHFKNEKGIGIIEVVAALGISIIVLTSLVSLSLFSLRTSLHSELQLEGTKIANREIELIRAYRDASEEWENDSDGFLDEMQNCSASPCYMDYSSGLSVMSGTGYINQNTAEQIARSFIVTNPDGSELSDGAEAVRVSVTVSWQVGKDIKYARVYTDLTNWANK